MTTPATTRETTRATLTTRAVVKWATGLWTLAALGCASSYHCYTGCHVNCRYCPPPPLPHRLYSCPVCHSWAATNAIAAAAASDAAQMESEHNSEPQASAPIDEGEEHSPAISR